MSGAVRKPRRRAQRPRDAGVPRALTRSRSEPHGSSSRRSLIVSALVAGWPLARTIWFSLTDANLNNLGEYEFIGFENYLANYDGEWLGILTDPGLVALGLEHGMVRSRVGVHRDGARAWSSR